MHHKQFTTINVKVTKFMDDLVKKLEQIQSYPYSCLFLL